jgi:hypothetical protein
MISVAIPDKWLDDKEITSEARRLGRQLINAINPDNIETNRSGTQGNIFENVNFHRVSPQVIRRIDQLYLDALGLLTEPLLEQLRIIRSNSNWQL